MTNLFWKQYSYVLFKNSRRKLSKIFEVEFLGQVHLYLLARINPDANFNIIAVAKKGNPDIFSIIVEP